MSELRQKKAFKFEKEGLVSVWFSTYPYNEVPDSYFDEDEQGLCAWAKHFKMDVYDHECLETNGAQSGEIAIEVAVGECSYSRSFVDKVVAKVNKMGQENVTWVILLFDYEYRPKKSKVYQDEYVKFVGAFPYDLTSPSMFNVEG